MKKSLIMLTLLFVILLFAASCASGNKKSGSMDTSVTTEPSTSTAIATSAPDIITQATSADATAAIPTPTPTPTATPTPDPNLDAILDKISTMEEGTAGSSLKQAVIAGTILDWVEDSSLSQDSMKTQMNFYLADLPDSAAVDLFVSNFAVITADAQLIIDGDTGIQGSLLNAGYTLTHASYTQSKWNSFVSAVQITSNAY